MMILPGVYCTKWCWKSCGWNIVPSCLFKIVGDFWWNVCDKKVAENFFYTDFSQDHENQRNLRFVLAFIGIIEAMALLRELPALPLSRSRDGKPSWPSMWLQGKSEQRGHPADFLWSCNAGWANFPDLPYRHTESQEGFLSLLLDLPCRHTESPKVRRANLPKDGKVCSLYFWTFHEGTRKEWLISWDSDRSYDDMFSFPLLKAILMKSEEV